MGKSNLRKNKKNIEENKSQEQTEKESKKDKKDKALPLIPLPIVDFDDEIGLAIMEDGSYCDFLEVITKDLQNASDDQLLFDKMLWERLFDTYSDDLKVISFSFPAETDQQQKYLEQILEKTENPGYRKFLQMRMDELIGIPKLFLTQAFVLCFYAKGYAEYKNKYIQIMSSVGKIGHPLVRTMPAARKKAIIEKLCNKNLSGGEDA